jgi:hypothetical protein
MTYSQAMYRAKEWLEEHSPHAPQNREQEHALAELILGVFHAGVVAAFQVSEPDDQVIEGKAR